MITMIIEAQRLADAKLFVDVKPNGDIEILDDNPPFNLFTQDAINLLCNMFGDVHAEQMLADAHQDISRNIFARKLADAMVSKRDNAIG